MEKKPVIAIVDCADGNDCVGSMWQEAKIFDGDTPLRDVLVWAGKKPGIGKITIRYESDP